MKSKKEKLYALVIIAGVILFIVSAVNLNKLGKGYYDKSAQEKKIIDKKWRNNTILMVVAALLLFFPAFHHSFTGSRE